jgi:aryl carrier-like protein
VLSAKPNAAEIRQTVHRAIAEIVARSGRTMPAFGDDDLLVDTGLASLDLAALVARLERVWRVDPFLEAVAITEMRTVGDLCGAYRDFIDAA